MFFAASLRRIAGKHHLKLLSRSTNGHCLSKKVTVSEIAGFSHFKLLSLLIKIDWISPSAKALTRVISSFSVDQPRSAACFCL